MDILELLCDAEVEQLHRAIIGDEDVRRLEVAVNDGVAVGMLDRLADTAEEAQPLGDRQLVPLGEIGER